MHRFRWPTGIAVLAILAAFGVLSASASSSRVATKAITPSPAWSDAQLSAPAGNNWLEYYGSLTGDRYSSLNQITTSNVSTLKEVWHIEPRHVHGRPHRRQPRDSGRAEGGSGQPDQLRLDGVEPGRGRRRALHDERSAGPGLRDRRGDRQHHLDLDAVVRRRDPEQRHRLHPRQRRPPPGVAVGEGLVFVGLPDGRLVALNQVTGAPGVGDLCRLVQEQREDLERPDLRQRHGSRRRRLGRQRRQQPVAPGLQGRERRTHLDAGARSRRPVSPATRPGRTTARAATAARSTAAARSGSPRSSTPPAHLVVVGTGNPEPWNSRGPGKNLYTDSIVGLDLYTGQLKWYFQQVHHDLWDSDLPNNGVMFDGKFKVNGKMVTRPAVAYVNKVGMTFVLDRVTGKPLIPVKEIAGSAGPCGRRQHLADAACPGDAERPVQPDRQGRNPVHDARTPSRASAPRSPRRPRLTASRTRSVARTPRTTRRSTRPCRSR